MGATSIRHSRVGTKFCLKMTLLKFWIKLTQKGYFQTIKIKITIAFYILKLIQILNLSFNKEFWCLEQISKRKVYFRSKTRKNERHYWIPHIRISLCTNFHLKLTIAIFWTKFANKGSYFQSKTDKIDTTIEFCIFELVFVSNFTLNKQFWIFKPNLPNKDIYDQKQKKWTSSLNSVYSN